MKVGNHRILYIFILFMLCSSKVLSQEKLKLENIQPSFETISESQNFNNEKEINTSKLKSKIPKNTSTGSVIVKFKALDKITAKTSTINIPLGKMKKFGYLDQSIFNFVIVSNQYASDKYVHFLK